LNRSKLNAFNFTGFNKSFEINSIANAQPEEWDPKVCPLCEMGSTPKKPKSPAENWNHFQ